MSDKDKVTPAELRDKKLRENMILHLNEWKEEGFDTSRIEEAIRTGPELRSIKRAYNDFKEKVRTLKDIELDLLLMDTTGFEAEAKSIGDNLRNLSALDEVSIIFEKLKKNIRNSKATSTSVYPSPRKALVKRANELSEQGFNMKKIIKVLKQERDINKIKNLMESVEKKIGLLSKVKVLVDSLETDGFEADVRRIKKMISEMAKLNNIWKEVYTLRAKIKNRQKVVAQAEMNSKVIKVRKVKDEHKGTEKDEGAGDNGTEDELLSFRRIDIYIQLLQNILLSNKRLLTLDTLRLAQRALKKNHPKIMFFLIQKDFKIKSMMPDHPGSFKALEAYLNKLYENLSGLISPEEARERMRQPAKEYISKHIQEILASGLDDYFPMFLIIDENEAGEERVEPEVEEDRGLEDMVEKIQIWEEEGYKVDRLIQAIEGNKDLALALFRKVEEEVFWLKELEKDVEDLEARGLKKECKDIRGKLKYPERIAEIEDDILSLQMMLDMGTKIDDNEDLI